MDTQLFAYGLLSALLLGCGTANDRASTTQTLKSLLSDSVLTQESVNVNLSDAMDTLIDANMVQGSSTTLQLSDSANQDHDQSKREKKCEVSGDKAVVTLSSELNHSFSHKGKRITLEAEHTGKTEVIRTWSKEGAMIACKDSKRPDIDLSADVTGLNLKVSFERTMSRSFSRTKTSAKPSSGNSLTDGNQGSIKKSVSISAKGTREVNWTAHAVQADGTTTRTKTIVSTVERTHTRLDKAGEEQSISFKIEVGQEAPLKVQVTYEGAAKERNIVSKVIESGSMTATRSGDGKIVSSFDQLKLSFDGDDCSPVSGKMTTKIYSEGASEPSKIYQLTAEDGDYTLQDVTDPSKPVEADDVDFEMCDIADHKD